MNPYKTLRSVVRFGHIESERVERRLARAASVDDLRRIAKRRLPGGVFDYIDGGAEDERTVAANQAAFARVTYRPRVLRGYLYGLGAAGERGVDRVLDWFHADLVRTMSHVGAGTVADLTRDLLDLDPRPRTRS